MQGITNTGRDITVFHNSINSINLNRQDNTNTQQPETHVPTAHPILLNSKHILCFRLMLKAKMM